MKVGLAASLYSPILLPLTNLTLAGDTRKDPQRKIIKKYIRDTTQNVGCGGEKKKKPLVVLH